MSQSDELDIDAMLARSPKKNCRARRSPVRAWGDEVGSFRPQAHGMAQVVDSAVRRCTTQARSEEIKALQLGMQMLGYEHHFRNNGLLLRVNGDLTERQAEQYDAALSG